jgi:hypothetical protein
MKPKFISLAIASILSILLIVSCKHTTKTDDAALKAFLNNFSSALKPDTNPHEITKKYFKEEDFKILDLVNLLRGGNGIGVRRGPIFKVNIDVYEANISYPAPGIAQVIIPVSFTRDSIETRRSAFTLKINVTDSKNIKIIQVDGAEFFKDYIAYENLVKSKTLADKDIYSPITLASFKAAEQLKSRYDSVVWFEHINNKSTYYFVVKGKWDAYGASGDPRFAGKNEAKMGLVGPNLKEIISPEYDLVHNIDGTVKGLIELDKANKHGLCDTAGKMIVPVEYDQIFPVDNSDALAILRKGSDFYQLKKDLTISGKADLKIADILTQVPHIGPAVITGSDPDNITEYNSREKQGTVVITPSYLVDLGLFEKIASYKNPLRKNVEFDESNSKAIVNIPVKDHPDSTGFFETALYSIRNYFIGGRSEFYDNKVVRVIDKKNNRVYSSGFNDDFTEEGEGPEDTKCSEFTFRAINDSLFEVKLSSQVEISMPSSNDGIYLSEIPVYHYLQIKQNELKEIPCSRLFSFTKFIKMNDSYLTGCYTYNENHEQSVKLKSQYLNYVKNEIYASYGYKFKDSLWTAIFIDRGDDYSGKNVSVDDSLTAIDKYNINWLSQKIKATQNKTPANKSLAAK